MKIQKIHPALWHAINAYNNRRLEQQGDQTHYHLSVTSGWACLSMMTTFLTQVHSRMMGTSLVISSGLHIRQRTCTSRLPCCLSPLHLL